ncbi:hypothetical protein [Catellatospora sp. NPDC049133]|uniref:hypothetical protein n=1 Tax=Catellatospora sp. NPDC049133 TaxID=3155499 RepID=UPI0033F05A9F
MLDLLQLGDRSTEFGLNLSDACSGPHVCVRVVFDDPFKRKGEALGYPKLVLRIYAMLSQYLTY